jgi:hypothetical protein
MKTLLAGVLVVALGVGLGSAALAADATDPAPRAELYPVVDPSIAEAFIRELLRRWNDRGLDELLAEDFRDRQRLLDAFPHSVPPNARLRLLGISGVHTLAQERVEGALVSTVSATVHAQIEYEDPQQGFQRREGVGEYIFRIVRRAPR